MKEDIINRQQKKRKCFPVVFLQTIMILEVLLVLSCASTSPLISYLDDNKMHLFNLTDNKSITLYKETIYLVVNYKLPLMTDSTCALSHKRFILPLLLFNYSTSEAIFSLGKSSLSRNITESINKQIVNIAKSKGLILLNVSTLNPHYQLEMEVNQIAATGFFSETVFTIFGLFGRFGESASHIMRDFNSKVEIIARLKENGILKTEIKANPEIKSSFATYPSYCPSKDAYSYFSKEMQLIVEKALNKAIEQIITEVTEKL
jgi:hypothetical protein